MISPQAFTWKGDAYVLIGIDGDGKKRFLKEASWECGWYWGFGYVEMFTNNNRPDLSSDILMHQHFDSLFLRGDGYNKFFKMFEDRTSMSEGEMWKFLELMKSFYTARAYSDMLHRGGAGYSENPVSNVIKDDFEYSRINLEVIPEIIKSAYDTLGFQTIALSVPQLDNGQRDLKELFEF